MQRKRSSGPGYNAASQSLHPRSSTCLARAGKDSAMRAGTSSLWAPVLVTSFQGMPRYISIGFSFPCATCFVLLRRSGCLFNGTLTVSTSLFLQAFRRQSWDEWILNSFLYTKVLLSEEGMHNARGLNMCKRGPHCVAVQALQAWLLYCIDLRICIMFLFIYLGMLIVLLMP